jgi:hypothetical protein
MTSKIFSFLLLAIASVFFVSCQKEISDKNEPATEAKEMKIGSVTVSDPVHTVLESQPFSATANVTACLGYNIRIYGTVDFKINKVYDKDGNLIHFTRVWSIKGLEAERVGMTSVKFDVVAGQEMFSVKDPVLNTTGIAPILSPTSEVFIHQGTIVLENRETHERLVIRHQIIQVPGQGGTPFRSGWYMNGQKCGS